MSFRIARIICAQVDCSLGRGCSKSCIDAEVRFLQIRMEPRIKFILVVTEIDGATSDLSCTASPCMRSEPLSFSCFLSDIASERCSSSGRKSTQGCGETTFKWLSAIGPFKFAMAASDCVLVILTLEASPVINKCISAYEWTKIRLQSKF